MRYLPWFDLQVVHPFYTNGRCPDFTIEPTPETRNLLANHRCTVKMLRNGIRIYTLVTDQNRQFIPVPIDRQFTFHLRLRNPKFALFTDLTQITEQLAPLFTNRGVSVTTSVQLTLRARQPQTTEHFVIQQPAEVDSYVLRNRPLLGLTQDTFAVEGAISELGDYEEGPKLITVNSSATEKGDTFTVTYPTIPQVPADIFADVELSANEFSFDIAEGYITFQVAFDVKQVRWVYYLITDVTGDEIAIMDQSQNPLIFTAQADPDDEIGRKLATRYPERQRWRFVSSTRVLCQEMARKSIQLRIADEQVLGALANPSLQNQVKFQAEPSAEFEESALFEVIHYFADPLSISGG